MNVIESEFTYWQNPDNGVIVQKAEGEFVTELAPKTFAGTPFTAVSQADFAVQQGGYQSITQQSKTYDTAVNLIIDCYNNAVPPQLIPAGDIDILNIWAQNSFMGVYPTVSGTVSQVPNNLHNLYEAAGFTNSTPPMLLHDILNALNSVSWEIVGTDFQPV